MEPPSPPTSKSSKQFFAFVQMTSHLQKKERYTTFPICRLDQNPPIMLHGGWLASPIPRSKHGSKGEIGCRSENNFRVCLTVLRRNINVPARSSDLFLSAVLQSTSRGGEKFSVQGPALRSSMSFGLISPQTYGPMSVYCPCMCSTIAALAEQDLKVQICFREQGCILLSWGYHQGLRLYPVVRSLESKQRSLGVFALSW